MPIPADGELSGNSVNVLHVEGDVVGAPFRADPFVFEPAYAGLDPPGQLKVNYDSYHHGVIPGPGFSATSHYEILSMETSADIRLVSDDPGMELIYRK